jgi:hypothetical protein
VHLVRVRVRVRVRVKPRGKIRAGTRVRVRHLPETYDDIEGRRQQCPPRVHGGLAAWQLGQ